MIKLFKILQNFKDIFKKKKIIFFKNFGGAQAPLGHQVALSLSVRAFISDLYFLSELSL